MKKLFPVWIAGVVAGMLIPAGASAAEYFVSEYSGAQSEGEKVVVTGDSASITYEWHTRTAGRYQVSFPDLSAKDCTVTVQVNDSVPIPVADITKAYEMGFDVGFQRLCLTVQKTKSTSEFSLGKLLLTEAEATDSDILHLECNNYTQKTGECYYYPDYGTDLYNEDVSMFRAFGKSAVAEFMLYAPASGEYVVELAMSDVGQSYTSDTKMTVNGVDYPLNAGTVTKIKNLTNASDAGLFKRFRRKNTVTLREGMNRIVFSSTESRNADTMHIFFLDCAEFKFYNDSILLEPGLTETGSYSYDIFPAEGTQYQAEVGIRTDAVELHELADCSVNGIALTKGTTENALTDATVSVVSEYEENGALFGTYRLKNTFSAGNKLTILLGETPCTVEKLLLTPVIQQLGLVTAKTDGAILLPGETAKVSAFATDKNGYAINLQTLQERGGITYQSSDREILAVDAHGKVTARKPGIATVTVTATDGQATHSDTVRFHVYHEDYAFAVIGAEKKNGQIQVRVLSPFGTKAEAHQMYLAQYQGNQLLVVTGYTVDGLTEGQIKTYTLPDSGHDYKVISVSGTDGITPVYDAVTVREGAE